MSQPKLSFAVYEPRRLSEEEFLAGFVARTDLAEFLLAQLRRLNEAEPAKHRLIIGQRGMGKTSLLRRIAIGVEADPDLKERYASLTFREEQYNVRSIDQFWRNCGEAFAEWLERLGHENDADNLDRELTDTMWRDPGSPEYAFLSLAERWGKRPVLLVDNLDLILSGIPAEQHWSLRNVLQRPGGPVLYGASVSFMQTFGSNDAAFYEFFSVDRLEPLGDQELMLCLQRMAERREDAGKPVLEILAREPQRLKVLHTLTGGNPRILVLIYHLLERVESDSVFSDLEALLDQLTPFYKAKIEEIHTGQPRAILDAIALNWDPMTSRAISSITGIEVTTISSQLHRLKNDGFIEEVETSGARAGYQVAERFFNIWYLMRHGTRRTRQKMRWLTIFLKNFYSYAELEQLKYEISTGKSVSKWKSEYEEAISSALDLSILEQSIKINLNQTDENVDQEPDVLKSSAKRRQGKRPKTELENEIIFGTRAYQRGDFPRSIEHLRTAGLMDPSNATVQYNLGVALSRAGEFEEAEASFRRSIQLDASRSNPYRALGSMLARGERTDEAKDLLYKAVEINPSDSVASLHLGNVLSSLGDVSGAEKYYRASIQYDDKLTIAYSNLGKLMLEQHRFDDAIRAFEKATELNPSNVSYWSLLGRSFIEAGNLNRAVTSYRSAIESDPKNITVYLKLAEILVDLQRSDEAETVLSTALDLDPENARVHSSLGLLWVKLGRLSDALGAFDAAVKFNPDSAVGHANLALCLYQLRRVEEAEIEIRRAIEIQPNNKKLNNRLAAFLLETGRHEEAIQVLRSCIKIDPEDADTHYNLGLAYSHAGNSELAEDYLRKCVRLNDKDPKRHVSLGRLLLRDNKFAQAAEAFTAAIRLDDRDAESFANLGISLLELEKLDEATKAFQTSLELGNNEALLHSNLGVALVRNGRTEEAENSFRKAIALDGSEPAPFNNLGLLLANQGRAEEAVEVLKRAVAAGLEEASILKMLGYVQTAELDAFEDAYESFLAATQIDPSDAEAWNMLGANLLDYAGDVDKAQQAFSKALSSCDDASSRIATEAGINFGWAQLEGGDIGRAREILASLPSANPEGLELLRAGIELRSDNLGKALEIVDEILARDDGSQPTVFEEGIIRFLKNVNKFGYGEKVILWLEDRGYSDKHAPLYASFAAFVRDERLLLDVSPEVRHPASKIYKWLVGADREIAEVNTSGRSRRSRGRLRKVKKL